MKNKLLTISKIGLLAFTILVSQACQEDYEMVDPPMITDYDDDLDEEVVLQKGHHIFSLAHVNSTLGQIDRSTQ